MKEVIVGIGLQILFTLTLIFQTDTHMFQERKFMLKTTAEEIAAAGAQYFDRAEYGNGYYVFNPTEAKEAMSYILKDHLRLNESLQPTEQSYWKQSGAIQYDVTFIDYSVSSNTFPATYEYTHFGQTHSVLLFGPSVITTINVGEPRYTLAELDTDVMVTAIHTLEE